MAQAESRLELDTERLDAASEAQRERLTELETQFARAADEPRRSSQEQLEVQERERRRALHEVAERLRQRERELRERVAAEEAEAIQRIQAGFADTERRQLDQLKRVVERTADSFSEAISKQFAEAIRQLARRRGATALTRARPGRQPLRQGGAGRPRRAARARRRRRRPAPRAKALEIGSTLEHERDELVAELQRRVGDAELELALASAGPRGRRRGRANGAERAAPGSAAADRRGALRGRLAPRPHVSRLRQKSDKLPRGGFV